MKFSQYIATKISLRKNLLAVALVLGCCGAFAAVSHAATLWQAGYSYTTVVNDSTIENPTGLEVAPDGRIFISERSGKISIVSSPGGTRQTLATLPVDSSGERGLLNIALDNDFANHPFLYVYYTGTDSRLRIGKMSVTSAGLGPVTNIYTGTEQFNQYHNGGGLDTDMQGHVYFSIGENYKPQLSQDVTVENGKVMRINRDGSIPADNPYVGNAAAPASLYARGFRNPFRLSVDRTTGDVYVGDVGSEYAEEVNKVLPGRNYGWPDQEGGRCSDPCAFERPIYYYNRGSSGLTIILGAVYRGSTYPAAMQGKIFFGDWMVGLMDTVDSQAPHSLANFSTGNGNIIDFDLGADGKIYFIEHYSHKVTRIDYNGSDVINHEPTAAPRCTPLQGGVPLVVQCEARATDEDGDTLTYSWDFESGATSVLTNPSHTYTTAGAKTVTLKVSDGKATITSAPIRIQAGILPTVTITEPTGPRLYKAGETINYKVDAHDASGNPIDNVSVKINLHHNEHEHDLMPATPGKTGSVAIPTTGETEPTIFYRIYATATDTNGLQATTTRDVQMLKTRATLKTSLNSGTLQIDGVGHPSGTAVEGVVGVQRSLTAPQTITDANGLEHEFVSWSDGGARTHTISFPDVDSTFTAQYRPRISNLVKNPSLDEYSDQLQKPTFWRFSRWDNMQSTFTFKNSGKNESGGCRIDVRMAPPVSSSFCHPEPMTIQPGQQYTFKNSYKSNAFTAIFALFTNDSGMYRFEMLSSVLPSSVWDSQEVSVTPPAGAQRMTIFQSIHSMGTLQTDDYALTRQ